MLNEMFAQLETQVSNEFSNSFVYLSIANFCYQQKLNGLGNYYKKQSEDERSHAQKIIDYLLKSGLDNIITINPIMPFIASINNIFGLLDTALALEQATTEQINKLMERAIQLNDYATQEFLQWFVMEQVAEEHEANTMIAQAKLNGSYDDLALRLLNDNLID